MIQFYTLVKHVLEDLGRTDIWFYWRVPKGLSEEQMSWFPQHPNIRYVLFEQNLADRVQEYLHFSPELERDVDFWGSLWDYDILITVRAPLVPLMRLRMNSPRQRHRTWFKQVWLIEEMPLMAFKGTVPVMNGPVQDHLVLQSYLAADRVWILSYHEQIGINDAARVHLSASNQREVMNKIQPVVTLQFQDFQKKTKAFFTEPKPFCVAFVGRMEKGQAQLQEVNDLMFKAWVTKGDNVRLLACTPSKTIKVFDQDLIECGSFPRQEFWGLMRDTAHVVISLGKEMGFSLNLLEPLMLGTPAIVLKRPYAIPLLGEDYPFYVSGPAEAQGMVEWFYRNYPTAYARFMKYYNEWLIPTYKARFVTDLLYPKVVRAIDEHQEMLKSRLAEMPERTQNSIVQLIAAKAEGRQEFVLLDLIAELGEDGSLQHLAKKTDPEWSEGKSLPWLPTWNDQRLTLKYQLGWEDASTAVGHLRRIA